MRADDLADGRFGLVARGNEAVRVRGEPNAVGEDGDGEIVDVVGDAVVAAAQERPRARGVAERHGGARRGAEGEQRRRARRHDQRVEVVRERRCRSSRARPRAAARRACAGSSTHGTSRAVSVVPVEHEPHLDLRRRVADADAEEEAIELRLGQRKRSGEVLRVLRRDDEERLRQRDRLPVERDLPLVHRLEQRGLRARARAVDFVGEEDVREDRAPAGGRTRRCRWS